MVELRCWRCRDKRLIPGVQFYSTSIAHLQLPQLHFQVEINLYIIRLLLANNVKTNLLSSSLQCEWVVRLRDAK